MAVYAVLSGVWQNQARSHKYISTAQAAGQNQTVLCEFVQQNDSENRRIVRRPEQVIKLLFFLFQKNFKRA
jgi:hypothetical protein